MNLELFFLLENAENRYHQIWYNFYINCMFINGVAMIQIEEEGGY